MSNVYERLRERLDKFPQGFPKTESGVELEILQHLFTPDEAEVMLHVRPVAEKVTDIAERAGKDETELAESLYDMSRRGLLMRNRAPDGEIYYLLMPWMVGIWEFQLNRMTPENIELYERYFREGMVLSLRSREVGQAGFRVIPVEKEVEGSTEIEPYEKVSQIIDSNTRFAVAECICRKERRIAGDGCDKLLEGCMTFGPFADFYIENGLGREVSKEEARQVLQKAEEDGLVHCSSNHAGNKTFVCNCCNCCCKVLTGFTKYGNPRAIGQSNYYATTGQETCTVCGTCVDRCPVSAVQIDDDHTVIARDRCIGCGLCASTCPTGSMTMVRKSVQEASFVFSSGKEMLQAMAKEAHKVYPFD